MTRCTWKELAAIVVGVVAVTQIAGCVGGSAGATDRVDDAFTVQPSAPEPAIAPSRGSRPPTLPNGRPLPPGRETNSSYLHEQQQWERERERVRASFRLADPQSPEHAAAVQLLSDYTGLDPATVNRRFETLSKQYPLEYIRGH